MTDAPVADRSRHDGQYPGAEAPERAPVEQAQVERQAAAGRIAGAVAHDLANLLTAIFGGADLLLERRGLDVPARAEVRLIRACAERAAALARRLAAHGGTTSASPDPLVADSAIRGAVPLLRRVLGPSRRLRLTLDAAGAAVRIDPVALDQILLNLATNAAAVLPAGGTFTLRSTTGPDGGMLIEARDDGPGIDNTILPRLFAPYATTRHAAGGIGLGLATVHELVRMAGGSVEAGNPPEGGACFRIFLPIAERPIAGPAVSPVPEAAAAGSIPAPANAAPDAGSRAVLLVDDEPSVLAITARALRRRGWSVVACRSAEAALALDGAVWPSGRPDAVIADAALPGLDGPALLRALDARWPGLPAVLVSGYEETVVRRGRADAVRASFLAKPYTPEALARAVDSALSG